MIKTLTRHGNSYALVIDKAILELLDIAPDCPLEITTDGTALVVKPARDADREARFSETLDRVNGAHRRALKKLAE